MRELDAPMHVDLGERIHIRSEVKPVCNQNLPFEIRSAAWELYDESGSLEAEGTCTVNLHEMDALIQPKHEGRYIFRYVYEIADEIWVDKVKVVVS